MDPEYEFLDGLTGRWGIEGHMNLSQPDGAVNVVPLNQVVEGRWILGDSLVELRIRQLDETAKPYEALYLMGFDHVSGKHIFHLFDSFGATKDYSFGSGIRREDFVSFRFDYLSGPFFNELIKEDDGSWSWHLTYERDGEMHIFAEKRMRRLN